VTCSLKFTIVASIARKFAISPPDFLVDENSFDHL